MTFSAAAADLHGYLEVQRYRGTNVNVLHIRSEPFRIDGEVVGIKRDIPKDESSRAVGGRGPVKLADRVMDLDGRSRYHRARRVGNHSAQRRTSRGLGKTRRGKQQQ